ncbi:hypothetical protein [Bacillus sp. TE8-1]|uniref:hypothetical protein n=1 Tax=Bacillus sp. TE8-1 TaxID=2217829 RepID=UPI0011EC6D48|nr:hypothetical protein [Bacillus sp. TE8-1]KAA0761719.1 hypothetical protein DN404_25190 [Bacillus sp. TE8-1]
MEFDTKLYKSFFILRSTKQYFDFLQSSGQGRYEGNRYRFFISKEAIKEDKCELKLIWETEKEIKSERIDSSGEIVTDIQSINEVNKSLIWIYNDENPFIFVFTTKYTLLKDIQDILFAEFGISSQNISFTNDFFKHLINSDKVDGVQSASFRTNKENSSSITISGDYIHKSYLYDNTVKQGNEITEMKVVLREASRVKIYKNSKIIIYNANSKDEIFKTIFNIRFLIKEGGYFFE